MQVNSSYRVVSIFQSICEAFALLLSKLDVITTHTPVPSPRNLTCNIFFWWLWWTATSGYFAQCALTCDFVCNGGSIDGVDKTCLSGGCKKITRTNRTATELCWTLGGLMVSKLNSRSSAPGLSPDRVNVLCFWTRHFKTLTYLLSP